MTEEPGTQTCKNASIYNAKNLCHALVQASQEEKSCHRERLATQDFPHEIVSLFWEPYPGRWIRGRQTQTPRSFFYSNKGTQVNENDIRKAKLTEIVAGRVTKRKAEPEDIVKSKVFKTDHNDQKEIIKPLALVDPPTSELKEVFYPEINYIPTKKSDLKILELQNELTRIQEEKAKLQEEEIKCLQGDMQKINIEHMDVVELDEQSIKNWWPGGL